MEVKFGRVFKEDTRDEKFPVSEVISNQMPAIPKKNWWADGWHGNQTTTPFCVVYSWSHWFEDGPVIQNATVGREKPLFNTRRFYDECQLRDQIPGTNYDGTTVRAGAAILKELGVISEYRWAFRVEDVIKAVTYLGPMVVGTMWYSRMTEPTSGKAIMHPRGRSEGGHAYLINGVDNEHEMFRVKNSWGRNWGIDGHAFISFRNFENLLARQGEACIAFQNKIDDVPSLDTLRPVR